MIKLSAVIITYNEEKKIEKCLSSLTGIVDEIVVVDSFSTDNTEDICKQFEVTFVQQEFLGYIEQKNFAITQATHDHIISLDADEALSCELQNSLVALKSNWTHDGYYMNRYTKSLELLSKEKENGKVLTPMILLNYTTQKLLRV